MRFQQPRYCSERGQDAQLISQVGWVEGRDTRQQGALERDLWLLLLCPPLGLQKQPFNPTSSSW